MRRVATLLLLSLCLAPLHSAISQNVSTHDYAPGSSPTGTAVVRAGTAAASGQAAESMAKSTATLDIPPVNIIPVIDGVLSPGEWSDAVQLNPAQVTGTNNTAWMKIDACFLHIAAVINTSLYTDMNATMLNLWFDLDQDGTWDLTGNLDGNIGLPGPGWQYPADVAAFGHPGLGGDWALSGGRLRYFRPWYSMGSVLPPEQITVVRTFPTAGECHIEAKIDYRTSPLRLTGGVPFNMRLQWYHGYYLTTGSGTVTIMAQWPTANTSAYFTGPLPTELADVLPANVVAPPDVFDITEIEVVDNPQFSSKAYTIGDQMTIDVDYVSTAPPAMSPYVVNIYGPHPSTALFATYNGTITAAQASGSAQIVLPVNLPVGFFRIEVIVDDPWVCGVRKIDEQANILILLPGQIPCTVWPGDVNRDDIVNYGDRAALNTYIHDANLSQLWLNGPGRLAPHFPDALAEYEWTGQAAAPWATPQGCHMDADGNGTVNNFDYIAIKLNWLKSIGNVGPKNAPGFLPLAFHMGQNYPNPFNPSTTIELRLPERSVVRLLVFDRLGRNVATLVDREMDAGIHNVLFDGANLATGTYIATAVIEGTTSGLVYEETVSMTLMK